jgi:hypothetical protein
MHHLCAGVVDEQSVRLFLLALQTNQYYPQMKKLWIFVVLCVLVAGAVAQGPVAVFSSSVRPFEVSGNGSVTRFSLLADDAQIAAVQAEAAKYPEMINLSVTPSTQGMYSCVLEVTGQPEPEYVHKMFLAFGIEKLQVNGQQEPLSALVSVLNQ